MTFAVMACMNGADGDMRAEKGRGERERRGKRAIQATLRPIMKKFTLFCCEFSDAVRYI